MRIVDCEQGSDEWRELRLGIPTASKFDLLSVSGKGDGNFGVGALAYMDELIAEQILGEAVTTFTGNAHTERGQELEDTALNLHCESEDFEVTRTGIILNHGAGYSPDAILNNDGLAEVKTKLPKLQVKVLLDNKIPKEHIYQCQGGLWIAEREWIDFICYWPGLPLFVKRAYRDEKTIAFISARVAAFLDVLNQRKNRILKQGKYHGT